MFSNFFSVRDIRFFEFGGEVAQGSHTLSPFLPFLDQGVSVGKDIEWSILCKYVMREKGKKMVIEVLV